MKQQSHLISILILAIGLFMSACIPERPQDQLSRVEVDLSDTVLYKIWRFGAGELTDSLLPYFQHRNPTYRWASLLPFASYTKKLPLEDIIDRLKDENSRVRTLAAYVLGQSHNPSAVQSLVASFDSRDSLFQNVTFNAAILEAVGKTGSEEHAKLLSGIKTYLPGDSLLTLAQVRALYQMALRDIKINEARQLMINRVSDPLYKSSVRIVAANYLARFQEEEIQDGQFSLIRAFEKDAEPEVQMYLAAVLPYCKAAQAKESLINAIQTNKDYRVRLAAIKALEKYPAEGRIPLIVKDALSDQHPKVSAIAAQYYVNNGEENEAVNYREWSRDENLHWKSRYILLGAALKNLPFYYQLTKTSLNGALKRLYTEEEDPYRQAVILENMAWDPSNTAYLLEKYEEATHPIILTTAVRMLDRILSNSQFSLILRNAARSTERQIFSNLKEIIQEGPNGPLCEAALIAEKFDEKALENWGEDLSFIPTRYKALELPAQLEAAQYLEQLMNEFGISFEKRDYRDMLRLPERTILRTVNDSTLIEVETNKGRFVFEIYPKSHPATVSNLLELVQSNFYDDKRWHRIVPNFVAQTGCPDGDGYGSLDYTIRSEFGHNHYAEAGYIGMASAGPHTECTQWFVTLAATPHLDGRYTLFGKVREGMDILHQLEEGDQINKVNIINQ